jgi:hypothetical protein
VSSSSFILPTQLPTFGCPTAHLFSSSPCYTPANCFATNSVPSLFFFIFPAHFQPSLWQHLQQFLTYSYRISPVPGPLFPIPSIPQISVPHNNLFSHITTQIISSMSIFMFCYVVRHLSIVPRAWFRIALFIDCFSLHLPHFPVFTRIPATLYTTSLIVSLSISHTSQYLLVYLLLYIPLHFVAPSCASVDCFKLPGFPNSSTFLFLRLHIMFWQ